MSGITVQETMEEEITTRGETNGMRVTPTGTKELGITTAAAHVDHIIPINKKYNGAMFDSRNYQSLCASCHSIKTRQEDKGVDTPMRKNKFGYNIPKT